MIKWIKKNKIKQRSWEERKKATLADRLLMPTILKTYGSSCPQLSNLFQYF